MVRSRKRRVSSARITSAASSTRARARREVVVVADRNRDDEQRAAPVAVTELADRHVQLRGRIARRLHQRAIDLGGALRRVERAGAPAQTGSAPEHERVVAEKNALIVAENESLTPPHSIVTSTSPRNFRSARSSCSLRTPSTQVARAVTSASRVSSTVFVWLPEIRGCP